MGIDDAAIYPASYLNILLGKRSRPAALQFLRFPLKSKRRFAGAFGRS
jgi:hypothetical protein